MSIRRLGQNVVACGSLMLLMGHLGAASGDDAVQELTLDAPDLAVQYAVTAVRFHNVSYQAFLAANRRVEISQKLIADRKAALDSATTRLAKVLQGQSPFSDANEKTLLLAKAVLKVAEADYQAAVEANRRVPGTISKIEIERLTLRIILEKLKLDGIKAQL